MTPRKRKRDTRMNTNTGWNKEQSGSKKIKSTNEKLNEINIDCLKININTASKNGEEWNLKITSWNVDGLRAWLRKGGLKFINHENPDILCLQEIKCAEQNCPPQMIFRGYNSFWTSAGRKGYSGVVLFSKEQPLHVYYGMGNKGFENEGRLITAEFKTFYLVNVYVPNAGKGLKTLTKRISWDTAFRKYLKTLDIKKPIILCGDMNVSHQDIDLANPKTNSKNAGFTKEERDGMTKLLSQGFIDTFRYFYPNKTGAYTFWTYRRKARSHNIGWRLDYFIVSKRIIDFVYDTIIHNKVLGSDHCPITLLFREK